MLTLQVYVPRAELTRVLTLLRDQRGVDHVVQVGTTVLGDSELVTADLATQAVDTVLPMPVGG